MGCGASFQHFWNMILHFSFLQQSFYSRLLHNIHELLPFAITGFRLWVCISQILKTSSIIMWPQCCFNSRVAYCGCAFQLFLKWASTISTRKTLFATPVNRWPLVESFSSTDQLSNVKFHFGSPQGYLLCTFTLWILSAYSI